MLLEQATTGRATCKGCKKKIDKDAWRFGDEVPGNFDGMMTFWYHLDCAVEKKPEKLKQALARKKKFPGREEIEARLDGATVTARTNRLRTVEHAKTSRSKCKACNLKIEKDSLRIVFQMQDDWFMGTAFLHVACASAFTGGDVEADVTKKAAKKERVETLAILRGAKLLDSNARGKQLVADTIAAKKPAPELDVLSDWLEEQGCAMPRVELVQLIAIKKKLGKKKKS